MGSWTNYIDEGYDPKDSLEGGRWMWDDRRAIRVWVQTRFTRDQRDPQGDGDGSPGSRRRPPGELQACYCGAKLTETCKTKNGNPTQPHVGRILNRRCPCGRSVATDGRHNRYCSTCREKAQREKYRRREIRTPTSQRRAA